MYKHSRKLNAHVCNRVTEAWGEATHGTHVRRTDAPCIRRRHNECLLFDATGIGVEKPYSRFRWRCYLIFSRT